MADTIPPELTQALQALAEQLAYNSDLLKATATKHGVKFDDLNKGISGSTDAFRGLSESQKSANDAYKEEQQAIANLNTAIRSTEKGFKDLVGAAMSTEHNFAKYNSSISSAGDAAFALGKTFGVLGTIVGGVFKGFTKILELQTTQADNTLKASDSLSKFTGAGHTTTNQLLDMAYASGITSKNLDLLVKPLSKLGSGLTALGGTAGEGVAAFTKLTNVSAEQRAMYSRMGVSQGELIENQADYVKLQQLSGVKITDQIKASGKLKEQSLAYTDNLLELSALSGKQVDDIKKQNEVEATRYEIQMKTLMQQSEAAALMKESNRLDALGLKDEAALMKAKADSITKEIASRQEFMQDIASSIGDEKISAGMSKFLATGVVTEESAMFKR